MEYRNYGSGIITKKREAKSTSASDGFEKKVLNASDKSVFISTSDTLEGILNDLVIDNDVYEKLCHLQDLIKRKLSAFTCTTEKINESTSILNSSSISLASCNNSLCSEKSVLEVDNSLYEKFLITVNCPFCLKPQADKQKLIIHLFESCQALMDNTLKERNFIPYSDFQILPNNTFKCNICLSSVQKNLKNFFIHKQSEHHKINYAKASKSKEYTEFVFCSCCKVLVPNNYTQLKFHMNHEVHKCRSHSSPKLDFNKLYGRKFSCVYLKSKKFKCLECSTRNMFQTSKGILRHLEDYYHLKNTKKAGEFASVFCEFCNENVHVFKILSHFSSFAHTEKEDLDSFELCYYCGFKCSSLNELSVHMKTQCNKIINLRKNILKSEKLDKNGLTKTEVLKSKKLEKSKLKTKNDEIEADTTKDGLHIIVKDTADVLELYKYFKKFGEISALQIFKEKNVLIKFMEKSVVEDVLLLQDVIQINGRKLEITIDETSIKPNNETEKEEKQKRIAKYSRNEIRNESEEYSSDSDEIARGSDNSDDLDSVIRKYKLEDLFRNVSHHLATTLNTSSGVNEKILTDCAKIMGEEKCFIIGFGGCKLSFPIETTSLYCDLVNGFENGKEIITSETGRTLFSKLSKAFSNSPAWEDVVICHFDFPHFRVKHKATEKRCAFFFTKFLPLLTDILRVIIEDNNSVKEFILIIRFWLSVHKLKIREFEFATISLVVFFLVSHNFVQADSYRYLLKKKALAVYNAVAKLKSVKAESYLSSINVTVMFEKFLKFLSEFNFEEYIICATSDYALSKDIFEEILNKASLDSLNPAELRDSAMCILDPLLTVNFTATLNKDDVKALAEAAQNTLRNIL